MLQFLTIALAASVTVAQNTSTSEILPLLRKGYVVPQILPSFNATVGPLTITYPDGIVNYGNTLNLSVVTYAPTVVFPKETDYADSKYTFLIVDGDAPTPQNPTSADIRHWAVADVQASSSATNYSSGNVLSAYKSPSPGAGSPPHRYTSVLLRQSSGINVSLYNQSASTSNFNLEQFIQQNSLTIVSANYFNASRTNASTTTSSTSGTTTGSGTSASSSTTISHSNTAISLAVTQPWFLILAVLVLPML